MRTSELVYQLGGVPTLGIPFGNGSKVFFVDPTNGSDGNDGSTPTKAYATLATAYAQTTTGQNDCVIWIGGSSSDQPSASITWSKSFTHLIGISSGLPGVGQRCRLVGSATADLTPIITFSGTGCIVRNIQFFNGKDANTDSGAVIVSGDRNEFTNCFIAGMGHATPAARAGSYSLTLSGSENHFERCSIGLDTVIRAAANAEIIVSGTRNRFWNCDVLSYSDTATKLAVTVAEGVDRWVEFKDCLFHNFSTNWTQALTNAFSVTAASTHYVILRGNCQFVGYTGVADTITHIYGAGPAPDAGMFLSTQPTT